MPLPLCHGSVLRPVPHVPPYLVAPQRSPSHSIAFLKPPHPLERGTPFANTSPSFQKNYPLNGIRNTMTNTALHREYMRRLTRYCLAEKKLLSIVVITGIIGFLITFTFPW